MISKNARYWIWITLALGYNTDKINKLYELYTDIAEFCLGGEKEWRFCGVLSNGDINKLKSIKKSEADKIMKRCEELEYSIVCIDDSVYPECLRNIYASPAVLYVSGDLPDIDNTLSIGIVGTRRASNYGTHNAYKFGYALSKCGVITVSGGALGVDCASHRGSLAAKGKTVCVLGCGINYNYLPQNKEMRDSITKDGALISEYPPDTPPIGYQFPARNRIIAALSNGVLIIESGIKSGSLITANYALEMGKELFALLGNNSPQNEGSNARIKEGTAIPVTDFMDILSAFDNIYLTDEYKEIDELNFADIEEIPVKGMVYKKPSNNNK
ncbi:MAG: DNA-processing protein DprA, partial [Ruminococcus sp.]|nr:DNA-processing protein DprA [Ruminococcus sp.]